MKKQLLIRFLEKSHSLWALVSLLFLDFRLHFSGPWHQGDFYPFEFGALIDQSLRLLALLILGSALLLGPLMKFSKDKRAKVSASLSSKLLGLALLVAVLCWCDLTGLPFGSDSNSSSEWVNRIAYRLSSIKWGLPLSALLTSGLHCVLCIYLWENHLRMTNSQVHIKPLQILGIAGLIALGTDAFLGYASGSPFLLLD